MSTADDTTTITPVQTFRCKYEFHKGDRIVTIDKQAGQQLLCLDCRKAKGRAATAKKNEEKAKEPDPTIGRFNTAEDWLKYNGEETEWDTKQKNGRRHVQPKEHEFTSSEEHQRALEMEQERLKFNSIERGDREKDNKRHRENWADMDEEKKAEKMDKDETNKKKRKNDTD